MCAGGRIVNYLKAMLGDARHNVLFVGYQAAGTPGREIQRSEQGGSVRLEAETYPIRAAVESISGYSAHGDQQDLLRFAAGIARGPEEIRVVHGDEGAKRALVDKLDTHFRAAGQPVNVWIPLQ
jgi:metallo-beta-lactamase family protein